MKKFFILFAVFVLLTLVVSCGEMTDRCDLEPYYECRDSNSYYCDVHHPCWYDEECELFEECEEGCNSSKGKCYHKKDK